MNREIKFRAWDKLQNYMAIQGTPDLENLKSFIYHFGDKPLMQSTGLHDKNGIEIYEGDIIGQGKNADVVKFKCGTFSVYDQPLGWEVEDFDADSLPYEREPNTWAVVIGNIFENPELLAESRHFKHQNAAI